MTDIYKEFDKYVKNYDFNLYGVHMKYYHTLRVVDIAKRLAKSLNLNEEDEELAVKCALLHDIARFKQITEYNTFIDKNSFDHGDMGEKILRENNYISSYEEDKDKQELILTTIRNHNKFKIEDNLDDRTVLFCKLVRDADKVDILRKQGTFRIDDNKEINENVCKSLINGDMVKNIDVLSKADGALRQLGFTYDLNFKESFKIIKEEKIMDNVIDNIKKYVASPYLDEIKLKIDNFLEEKLK